MTEYSKVNIKLSDWQLDNLKSPAKDQTEVTLRINNKMQVALGTAINNKVKNEIKKCI